MYTPSDDDVMILEAAAEGDLKRLQELEVKIGDIVDFRRRCELCKDCEGRKALHYAAEGGMIQICKFLIEKVKVDINMKTEEGTSSLLLAVATGHISTAEYLIIQGADIALSDSRGMTPLHYAAKRDNKEILQLLLSKGADIEANSVSGTPLQCAASCGNVESVRFLLGRGAKPNSVSVLSDSPLVWAIRSRSSECFKLLLKAGADPNISSCGLTPLACATIEGEAKFVRSLLAAGANPNSTCTDGLTPIELAALVNNHDGVRILFAATERIPNYPDWSIHGITEYFHSEKAKTQREQTRNAYFRVFDEKGKNAAKRKDYSAAVKWYSEAIQLNPFDARIQSNRSICWAQLGEAAFALHDAKTCVKLRPDWPKAYYREGVAWMLLKNPLVAAGAFLNAHRLDPENEEINKAYSEAVTSGFLDLAEAHPLEARKILLNLQR